MLHVVPQIHQTQKGDIHMLITNIYSGWIAIYLLLFISN